MFELELLPLGTQDPLLRCIPIGLGGFGGGIPLIPVSCVLGKTIFIHRCFDSRQPNEKAKRIGDYMRVAVVLQFILSIVSTVLLER